MVINSPARVLETDETTTREKVQLAGVNEQLNTISELARLAFSGSSLFENVKIPLPKAAIIHGPSGTGKSLLGDVLADHLKVGVIKVQCHSFFAKYVGQAEERITQ
jgi:ATP-dependent 26S proteasome regulatory subunit